MHGTSTVPELYFDSRSRFRGQKTRFVEGLWSNLFRESGRMSHGTYLAYRSAPNSMLLYVALYVDLVALCAALDPC